MLHFKIGILKITWGKTCHFEFQAHLKVQGLMLITQFLYKKKIPFIQCIQLITSLGILPSILRYSFIDTKRSWFYTV